MYPSQPPRLPASSPRGAGWGCGGNSASYRCGLHGDGTLLLRDTAKQVQDIATLSRDVEHANNALSPIFNKEKEQKRLKQAQMVKGVTIPKDESKITASDIAANAMAHAVVGAVVAQLSGQDAAAGAIGASSGAQSGRNAVENNSLGDIAQAQAQSAGKTLEQKAGEYVEAENERYKKENCAGLSAEACSVKMYDERREALKETLAAGADFVPVIGDIKSVAEAQSALDYLVAAIGIIPGAGDVAGKAIKAAEVALKKGDVAEASKLINKASDEISAQPIWKGSIVQSRVNLRVGDGSTGSGLEYAWKKHGGEWGANKSHFTVTQDELKTILQSDTVVKTSVQYSSSTGNYIRTVDMGKNIGVDSMNNGVPTSIMTVITDKKRQFG
ncbi:hypothetical protein [Pectobacterium brasiliense]|uniref:hypothetical protein n=1 Tax=Pectobacterium brasiliense TaxID=180957 RepID=UPI000ADA71EA|nr:hypothetical protein [Pectobacterium brasiliense]